MTEANLVAAYKAARAAEDVSEGHPVMPYLKAVQRECLEGLRALGVGIKEAKTE